MTRAYVQMTRAQQIAQKITKSFTDAKQFEVIAAYGCGKRERDAAFELLDGEDDCADCEECTVAAALDEIVKICKSH